MHKKLMAGMVLTAIVLTFTGCKTNEEQNQLQLAPILSYTSDKEENIKFVRTKNYDGISVKEYTDSEYTYEVTPDGKLMTIFLKSAPTGINITKATDEEITLKAEDNLKKLSYKIEDFVTTVSYDESKKQYTSVSRQIQGEEFTGNNVYIQYTSNGILISISFKYEDPLVLQTVNKITVEEAKDILINYFTTNSSTEKYAPLLHKDIIRSEVDVYNNKKVYDLYFTLETDEFGFFNFKYVISTETGIILYRKELR
ncbi:MAG: hypothetical protein WBI17_07555 [Clostridiaceae bacterium]